eukprot:TRINITY_DN470_c0_g1_i1.p1 TRINITY_DN470_c0_g1~~TRINITY_DN470_c0_g1_i1.p1  ORF type:complete len:235 (-),score=36.90 TRINITY_DN470_c0_g1_i1:2-706(-)
MAHAPPHAHISGPRPTGKVAVAKPAPVPAAKPAVAKPATKLSQQRLDPHKSANPFAGAGRHKTPFSEVYSAGSIPCRIEHRGTKMALAWTVPIETVDYRSLLPLCCEGLRETQHPYTYLSREILHELLTAEGAPEKTRPVLDQLIPPLRVAIMAHEDGVVQATLQALGDLSDAVGAELDRHLHLFLSALNKKLAEKGTRPVVEQLLNKFEQNGKKPEVSRLIKSKVPTYTPLLL